MPRRKPPEELVFSTKTKKVWAEVGIPRGELVIEHAEPQSNRAAGPPYVSISVRATIDEKITEDTEVWVCADGPMKTVSLRELRDALKKLVS